MKKLWYYDYPIGTLGICEENNTITHVFFKKDNIFLDYNIIETPLIQKAAMQIDEYLKGERIVFDLPLTLNGTDFQKLVWEKLLSIPIGETRSYKDIAELIGNPKASRAVGMANHCNPLVIIIPCHRVVGSNNNLTGYVGGLSIKEYLLDLEKSCY